MLFINFQGCFTLANINTHFLTSPSSDTFRTGRPDFALRPLSSPPWRFLVDKAGRPPLGRGGDNTAPRPATSRRLKRPVGELHQGLQHGSALSDIL